METQKNKFAYPLMLEVIERLDKNIDVMETINFTKISSEMVSNSHPSKLIPLMKVVASDWNLDIKIERNFTTIKRIINNSILKN